MSSARMRVLKKLLTFMLAFSLILAQTPAVIFSNADAATVIYHETFRDGTGDAVQSGGASLSHVSNKFFDGNDDGHALYISNRENNWDAADFRFSDIGLEHGKTYAITISGYVDEDGGAGGQPGMASDRGQLPSADRVDMEAGKAFKLTCEYTADAESNRALRILSNDTGAQVPFYVGDILITAIPDAQDETEIYHESFKNGTGIAIQSGGAVLTHVTDAFFDGNDDGGALYVSNRVNNWDGADFNFSDIVLKTGKPTLHR